ncbi:glycosyltransferase [bacterium]|nr:glycosyltransferase [bacterium]
MPRVLLVSFTYPPGFGSGGIRISKFAKFLPEFGWEPVVLTVDPAYYPFRGGLETLLGNERRYTTGFFDPLGWIRRRFPLESPPASDASSGAAPARTSLSRRILKKFRPIAKYIWDIIYFPDPQIGWYPYAVSAGHRIIRDCGIDVVFSSSPPHTDHLIGAKLSRDFDLPWVAEYRDPWTDQHTYRKSWPVSAIERRLERRTLERAAGLISISPILAERLSQKLGKLVHVIENGFDPDDLPPPAAATGGPFLLIHAGTLYRGQRDPGVFFEGLKRLREKMDLTPSRIQAQFVGVLSEMALELAHKHGVSDLVSALPREPYETVLQRQSRATALLLLGLKDPMGGGVLTGKMFEYFGLRRPILGVGAPDPDLEEIIRRTQTGTFTTTPAAAADVLSRWILEYERDGAVRYQPAEDEINKYHRRESAGKLSEILNRALGRGVGGNC